VDGASVVGDKVVTWVGGGHRDVLHPSVQAGQYRQYLADNHEAFHADDPPVGLQACAYLHNYHFEDDDVLLSGPFRPAIERDRLFSADDVRGLCEFLCAHLDGGGGLDILPRIEENRFRPSKKLMDHVARVIKERSEYVLLDEQPGTGKSVIVINLMAELLNE
jgi:hypothetical protein